MSACVAGVTAALVFANLGAAYGTAKSGVGIASMGVINDKAVMKNIIPGASTQTHADAHTLTHTYIACVRECFSLCVCVLCVWIFVDVCPDPFPILLVQSSWRVCSVSTA